MVYSSQCDGGTAPFAPDAESSEVCWITLALLSVQGKLFVYKAGEKTSEDR